VLTHFDLDAAMDSDDPRLTTAQSVAFIQCVGSRTVERPYCSRLCCTHTVKSALTLKERNPEMDIYVLYRDVRTYGFREELYIKRPGKRALSSCVTTWKTTCLMSRTSTAS
jgi:heterodisulfide reductase subunit A-like polyferredoxin